MYLVDYQLYQFIFILIVFCVIMYLRMLCTTALSTRVMLNVLGKCDIQGDAMQSFADHHDGVVKIKYRKELRSRCAKFLTYKGV